MSYKLNINKIDSQLKTVFENTKIDSSDYRQLYIIGSVPKEETVNDNLQIHLFVNQANLNNTDPILEWGYYTNSNDLKNSIKFKTPISNIGSVLGKIVIDQRLEESYLESIKDVKKVNESSIEGGDNTIYKNINETYDLSENHLKIYDKKLKNYFYENHGIISDDIELSHFDTTSGRKRESSFVNSNDPVMGDEAILEIKGISSINYDGNISPKQWITIENTLRKLPHVEDINSNTYNYSTLVTFSTKIFVELH